MKNFLTTVIYARFLGAVENEVSQATWFMAEGKDKKVETTEDYKRQGKTRTNREDVERFTYDVASTCKLGKFK